MVNLKKICILILIFLSLVGIMYLIKSLIPSPEKTVSSVVKALEKRDIEKMKKYFTGDALLLLEKTFKEKGGNIGLWAGRDYFKDIIWQIQDERKMESNKISCLLFATGGKGDRWEFGREIIFLREGWIWKISEINEIKE